jgi:acyl-CoA thioester hydrolase
VRYLEVDQQGVVFNMWYLAYFDDAMTTFLAEGGLAYTDLLAAGYDAQVVHTEIDWLGPLRWDDPAIVDVSLARLGQTSFALRFTVRVGDRRVADALTVYVVIATDGSGKQPIPPLLLDALGEPSEAAPAGAFRAGD